MTDKAAGYDREGEVRWISVKEELPDTLRVVLVFSSKRSSIHSAYRYRNLWMDFYSGHLFFDQDAITHWAEAPNLPKDQEEISESALENLIRNLRQDDLVVTVDGVQHELMSKILHYYVTNNPERIAQGIKSAVASSLLPEPLFISWKQAKKD